MARIAIIIFIFISTLSEVAFSQNAPWVVTPQDAARINPLEIKPKNLTVGRNLYARTCLSCHGPKADGQGLLKSASFLTDTFQKQSDGAIFHKIITGRDKMPPMRGMLKDDEVWSVINYFRVLVNPSVLPPPKAIRIETSANEEMHSIIAFLSGADSARLPIGEVDVQFYIKRDFGWMRFGELSNYTTDKGKATVTFPEDIIGDVEGNVEVFAKVENDFLYKDTESKMILKWGAPLVTEDVKFNQRALWGSRAKSPVWLLILANGILAGVWVVILYILYNLFRIKKAGRIFIK